MNLKLVKAGTSDALVLNSISKQAFESDVEAGAVFPGGPPGYQSVSFHVKMARMNHLFKLVDENGVIIRANDKVKAAEDPEKMLGEV